MNIEEIKETLDKCKKHGLVEGGISDVYEKDVGYLLSIIEQAEKDIETAYDYIKQTDQELTKNHLLKALKAVRGNSPKRGGLVNPDGGDYPLKWMSQKQDLE